MKPHTNMAIPPKITPELLDSYLAGSVTPAEAVAIESWMQRNPARLALVETLRSCDQDESTDPVSQAWTEAETVRAKQLLKQRMAQSTARPTLSMPRLRDGVSDQVRVGEKPFNHFVASVRLFSKRVAISAFVGLVVAFGIAGWWTSRSSDSSSVGVMTYTTGNAQRATIQFSDGTRVVLNVGSQIQIPENFSQGNRIVRLIGEASFQVTHIEDSPLVIETGSVRTRVLGTEFGVRAYEHSHIQVAVKSGRVAMNDVVLGARDIAVADATGQITLKHHQALDAALGFAEGRLVLNGISLQQAIPDLSRWYDVEVRVSDRALLQTPVYAILNAGSLSDLIEILQNTFNVVVAQDGRALTLTPKR